MAETTNLEALQKEYEAVNTNIRTLVDIRFKLLGFVPTLGGIAIYVLSEILGAKTSPDKPRPQIMPVDYSIAFLFGVMGFLVTLGITFYDQRNSELYNDLIRRAKYLEKALKLPADPAKKTGSEYQGQFSERPRRGKYLFGFTSIGHDSGLALIYGMVLGAWFFPIVYSGLQLLNRWQAHLTVHSLIIALIVACFMALAFIVELLRLDNDKWKKFRWTNWLWPEGGNDRSS